MSEDITDAEKKEKQNYEDKIKALEKRISELENAEKPSKASQTVSKSESNIHVEGIVESVVGQFIPGLGGIIKALEDSSPEFRKKIADTDAEIKHRIDVGWSNKPVVDYHVSTRPIRRSSGRTAPQVESVRMPTQGPVREPIVDVLEGKDDITVIAELPGVSEEELQISLEGSDLHISAGKFRKIIALPHAVKEIREKSHKNGILQIKLA